ncbi:uncharacterized protein [Dermacentor albipictus]|uniref:uncharacterized protein n=1 Tax=Dermacentor albipictus TaxID=60249 RepID=UPI0038FD24C2
MYGFRANLSTQDVLLQLKEEVLDTMPKAGENVVMALDIKGAFDNAAGITINPRKVQLGLTRINLLGFIVEEGTFRPDEKKLRAILQLPPPTDVKSLQRYLGMVGFYRHFIPNCADLARPLHQLLRKGASWQWTDVEQGSFRALSSAIADTARLLLPDLNLPFIVQTDEQSGTIP